jgi:hypothetical protein
MNQNLKTVGLSAVLAAAATLPAQAEVAINQYLSVEGYAAASGTFTKVSGGGKDYTLFDSQDGGRDSVFIGVNGKYLDFEGKVSLFYIPDTKNIRILGDNYRYSPSSAGVGILDAYAGWGKSGFAVRIGKFLTNLGYESFYARDMSQLSWGHAAWGDAGMGIGYHSGINLSYTAPDEKFSVGGAVLDSLYAGRGFYEGDGDLKNLGFELFATFKPNKESKIFAGVGYDSKNDEFFPMVGNRAKDQFIFDLYGTYDVTTEITLGAEFTYAENKDSDDGSRAWILFAKYTFPQFERKFAIAGRISSINHDSNDPDPDNRGSEFGFTLAPSYKFSDNLSLRAEISHLHGSGNYNAYFYGLQVLFQF